MPKNRRGKRSKNKKKKQTEKEEIFNFYPPAGKGCHISHGNAPWLISSLPFDPDEYECEPSELPDLSVDPDSRILSAINPTEETKVFYISSSHKTRDGEGNEFERGTYRDEEGEVHPCTTFILVLGPCTIVEVCEIVMSEEERDGELDLHSDVQVLKKRENPSPSPSAAVIAFPFKVECGPLLCTQGFGGHFTHFFPNTFHAIDFRCPVGMPVVAVGNGQVTGVRDGSQVSGIHVSNLFKWNSVQIRLASSGLVVEYVHLRCGSVKVREGQRVEEGEEIAETGDVGFSPEPHLHLQVLESTADDALSVPFLFQGTPFLLLGKMREMLLSKMLEAGGDDSSAPVEAHAQKVSASAAAAAASSTSTAPLPSEEPPSAATAEEDPCPAIPPGPPGCFLPQAGQWCDVSGIYRVGGGSSS
uniref:M23ase beta-sheet core domain-containing protein n=1 Tax=Chromera velia CCMP2878 TaxID=1169474 RepID=A0A0G4HJ56_9ALVE|eukprot:Cvel_28056.t1-p1 / transcript=Cvel_28056.t1 / gene=Cvel_28056 / organism=Chromera_velia_CCMP2878 / gene_product=hypothetical protein / transcript_product=hypothetical protein / location=Cvel_scaffold3606:11939-13870(+) / protein_length=415 / sequence_SO=supercontig / SO=protein_coding / is_pseudo=false